MIYSKTLKKLLIKIKFIILKLITYGAEKKSFLAGDQKLKITLLRLGLEFI